MQQVYAVFNERHEPGAANGVPREETPDAGLDDRPERLLSWLDMAERYYRQYEDEHAGRQS